MEFLQLIYYWLILSLILFGVGYFYIQYSFLYWKRHRIPFLKPSFPCGNFDHKVLFSKIQQKCYRQFKDHGPVAGIYIFLEPMLLITDLSLVQNILIKDFQSFPHRENIHDKKDPLTGNLFNLGYDEWKPLRAKFSPLFTVSKMKCSFPILASVAKELVACLTEAIQIDSEIEVGAWMGRYTTDAIASSILGFESGSLRDPEMKLFQLGRKVFDQPLMTPFRTAVFGAIGSLRRFYYRGHHSDVTNYFLKIVNETIAHRESNDIQRNDLMHLLIEMKNGQSDLGQLSIEEIAAQAFVFFVAGFDTSATTLMNVLYELSMEDQKWIQTKARNEIKTILEKYNGHFSYEAMNEMTYVNQIVKEVLRKHPIGYELTRTAAKSYKVPNTDFTIPKGMKVRIPVYSIHHDAEIYEEPDKFDPERFSSDASGRPSCSYLPFGDGNRNCIAYRYGMLQTRIALVNLLLNFEFSTCNRTEIPIKYNPKKNVHCPISVWLKVKKIN